MWSFQAVHHDLWDYDVAAPPMLVTLHRNGREVPAVVVGTKTGMIFVLDRETGVPLFPVEERPVPRSDIPGESSWGTQPFPASPGPLHEGDPLTRLGAFGEYRTLFEEAYPGTPFASMTFAHASNAIAGFILSELTFNETPWDRFLRGSDKAMTGAQLEGAQTFLSIRCSLCHNGAAFTDNQFHNVAVPQIGPGQGDGPSGNDDFGRMRVTGLSTDQYRFRTTPLRNVTLTGPYGHDGAIAGLREFIEHYSEPHLKLMNLDPMTLEPLLQNSLVANAQQILLTRDEILDGVVLPPEVVDQLMAFMSALDDPKAKNLAQRITPPRVPSGLAVDGAPPAK